MARVVKLGIKRPVTRPLLPDPEPRPVTYTIILTILQQEVEHEEDLQALLEDFELMMKRR
jgi:hypothetical protein